MYDRKKKGLDRLEIWNLCKTKLELAKKIMLRVIKNQ